MVGEGFDGKTWKKKKTVWKTFPSDEKNWNEESLGSVFFQKKKESVWVLHQEFIIERIVRGPPKDTV